MTAIVRRVSPFYLWLFLRKNPGKAYIFFLTWPVSQNSEFLAQQIELTTYGGSHMHQLVRRTAWAASLIGVLFMATVAAASGVNLVSQYRVLSSTDDGTGLNAVTLELTLTNPGSIDLTSMSLEVVPDRQLLVDYDQYLDVPSLSAGSAITVTWTVNSVMPVESWQSGALVRLHGTATDNAGVMVDVSTLSHPAQ